MELLPTSLGTRPRLAVEIRPEGVVAARAEDAAAMLSAVAYAEFHGGTLTPGLKAGNVATRREAVAGVKKVLESVALKERQTTLVLPDAAMRVLLLDFDALPAKAAEALPIVRFRLKKLLPFDSDDAVVSYQVMSSAKTLVRVLAVAVPKEVLAEYEGLVREAGFEPGAVLPSTLAAVAGLNEMEAAVLLVNASEAGVTTAIVQGSVLLLHRTVDMAAEGVEIAASPGSGEAPVTAALEIPVELLAGYHGVAESPEEHTGFAGSASIFQEATGLEDHAGLPLVDVESSAGEWARQEPVNGFGVIDDERLAAADRLAAEIAAEAEAAAEAERMPRAAMLPAMEELMEQTLGAAAREVTQAVSVAAAYFEDTLQTVPGVVVSAGTMGAERLGGLLVEAGFVDDEMRVREMVEVGMLTGGASTARVPMAWLAGVRGALRS